MQQTLVLLLDKNKFDRVFEAEFLDSSNVTSYNHMSLTAEVFGKTCEALPLSDFCQDCNDNMIDLDKYWLTYVMIKL